MRLKEIKGRAVHQNGGMRIDRRPETAKAWEYQVLKLLDPHDDPEWCPVDPEQSEDWPQDGWESVDDW
jgi:hypothetical protein